MWIENRPLPWLPMLAFNVVLSLLGVLVAFPMKRLFINDEQQPFPQAAHAASCSTRCTPPTRRSVCSRRVRSAWPR